MGFLRAGWFRRLAAGGAALAIAVTALGANPPAAKAGPGTPVVVGFFTVPPKQVCVSQKLKIEYYASFHPDYKNTKGDVELAPLVPPPPIDVTFTASHGTMFPEKDLVGPFKSFGQIISRWMTYTAKSEGHEKITIKGTNGEGEWQNEMEFEVVKCKAKMHASADMTPLTSKMTNELWTSVASLEMDGEAELGEDSVKGTGTANFYLDEQFAGIQGGVITCKQDPPWEGSGEVNVTGDAAALENGELALAMDFSEMPINATTFSCEGGGGMNVKGSFPLPAWAVAELNMQFDPLPFEGGSGTKPFAFGQYQIPMIISVVTRAES